MPFDPLAGKLVSNPSSRIKIDSTSNGALFTVARANFTGDELFRDFEPSPKAPRLLVPFTKSGEPPCVLAMVQVRRPCSASLGFGLACWDRSLPRGPHP